MSRYDTLLKLIDLFKPKTIVETGTWRGSNAARMISAAQRHNSEISYIGYDLFEEANPETDQSEFNVKPHYRMSDVEQALKRTGAEIVLIKGNTRQTLISAQADFAFIDGGHSLETINHDYEALKTSKVIVFDDYYTSDENGRIPDIEQLGCNKIVGSIPHFVMPSKDPVEGGGIVNLAIAFSS